MEDFEVEAVVEERASQSQAATAVEPKRPKAKSAKAKSGITPTPPPAAEIEDTELPLNAVPENAPEPMAESVAAPLVTEEAGKPAAQQAGGPPLIGGLTEREIRIAETRFKCASDANRITILLLLSQRSIHVNEICSTINLSQPAVSHHLSILRHSGHVSVRREGKNNFYSLTETGQMIVNAIRLSAK